MKPGDLIECLPTASGRTPWIGWTGEIFSIDGGYAHVLFAELPPYRIHISQIKPAQDEPMFSQPTALDHIASIQVDLACIRDQYPDQWDSDRILNFARALAIRSAQIQDRIDKEKAEAKVDASLSKVIERQFNSSKPVAADKVKAKTDWAMICHCLNLMEGAALHQFATKMSKWHLELRSALTMLDEVDAQDLAYVLGEMIAHNDFSDMDLIDQLPAHQRSQVYGKLTRSQMMEFNRLREEVE